MMKPMGPAARGFLVALAASAGGSALAGGLAAVVVALHPPGSGGVPLALLGLVVLPVAAALVAAGAMARTLGAVLLNSLAFLLPQSVAVVAVFFLFAHPGGSGGEGLLLATGEFWLKAAAAYALVVVLVGGCSLIIRRARR
jgi:hypothetical protein